MPRTKRRVRLTVYVLPKMVLYIDHLAKSGLYGRGARSQVAERLNMPLGGVGPTRARCLEQMKRQLEKTDAPEAVPG